MKKHNFCSGPCILPSSVYDEASRGILNFNDSGLSILEISHRSVAFQEILQGARNLLKELLQIPDSHSVLFLQGGASLQFSMAAMNFSRAESKTAYLDTGRWAKKAFEEAEKLNLAEVIATSVDKNYTYLPEFFKPLGKFDYLHFTSNNTIYGTQYQEFPSCEIPLIADMSSDILTREIDFSRFNLIYAGAQKNIGAAGSAIAIVNKEALNKHGRNIPSYLDYNMHVEEENTFNTPPVFAIYTAYLNLKWLKNQGGVLAMKQKSKEKSQLLYNEIDRNSCFRGTAAKENRSKVNVTFVLENKVHQAEFDEICQANGIENIKGHRTVGGYRASLYNALPIESVQALVNAMQELEKKINQ